MEAIEKGILVNQQYQDAEKYVKKMEGISRTTNWFERKVKFDGARKLTEDQKNIQKELEFGRRELVLRRTHRLEQLYQKETEEWERILREQGLAVYKCRI